MSLSLAFLVSSVPFTTAVIDGQSSLGGSESACLGTARALRRRGHDVHVFAAQLDPERDGMPDADGVVWHRLEDFPAMNLFTEFDVVCSLRMWQAFARSPVYARLRMMWNQDLLVPGGMQQSVMSVAWAYDRLAYVSEYHRRQWEHLQPDLASIGWVTRNGWDPRDRPETDVLKHPNRIIHISRPERGLGPLLTMWPALRAKHPTAELHLCRYSSMYDQGPGSWSDVCASWDVRVEQVNADVGGITYLGELTKPQLYKAISEAAVMWYPGVSTFAETGCMAALEAQACGTPFVGSYRGALPETCPSGILITGDAAHDAAYHEASVDAVLGLMDGCQRRSFDYRRRQKDGLSHAAGWTYDTIAEQWEAQILAWFQERYQAHTAGVLQQLLHEDDHTAARQVADAIGETKTVEFCDYVIAGKDHTAEQYGGAAIADPLIEAEISARFKAVIPHFATCTQVLDVACGNGSFALALAMAVPTVSVTGVDYSMANIERARDAAVRAGVADRVSFHLCPVYDFDTHGLHADWMALTARWRQEGVCFDGMFVGEFIEHVENAPGVIDGLEASLGRGAMVVYTCPHGACADLVPRTVTLHRGHVHRFHHDDIKAVWGRKADCQVDYFDGGLTQRGQPIGNWLIRYHVEPGRAAGARPLQDRIVRTRPFQRLSVGMIVKDAENDLARCLSSVYAVADEIVIGDTGSTDATKAIAAGYGSKVRAVDVTPVMVHPQGFAGARNDVLAQCTGQWFLWIDADEVLINPHVLRYYLDGPIFAGYVIRQTHLYLDGEPTWDIPVRLFRHTGRVTFYGCVHEQPQDGHANGDIHPSLNLIDVRIAHTGYLTSEAREFKRVNRNLPLLVKDGKVFPTRQLGHVLAIREAVIQADVSRAQHKGAMTDRAKQGYAWAIKLFIEHFDDPAHKYHTLARPWYESALRQLNLGWEQEIALAGRFGGLEQRQASPERRWVRDADEYQRIMAHLIKGITDGMQDVTFVTDPDVLAPKGETTPDLEVAV